MGKEQHTQWLCFEKRLFILGFGSIGKAVLPLIMRHFDIAASQITVLTKHDDGAEIAAAYGINYIVDALTQENYQAKLSKHIGKGDFLLNLSVDVASVALINYCQQVGSLYLDTCIEPWPGGYTDPHIPSSLRSNYALRESALALKQALPSPTAVITHGANPGLVSHFVKQALLNIAADNQLTIATPVHREDWAVLAHRLGIKVIHIAERDTQIASEPKRPGEFVNTWSVEGFIAEGSQPAELGWGSHEKHWPQDAAHHQFGCDCAIYLNRPGASTKVRTWTPLAGPFHGFLITHGESISISDYFTLKKDDMIVYRPTVHYAYHPCEDAVLSIHELAGREWNQQEKQRLLNHEIIDGIDELGVLLMGNQKGAYWFGSQLSIQEARDLAPYNTATSLQVAIGVLAAMVWAIKHPEAGIVEPDEIYYADVMAIAKPYLGKVAGFYTDWNPLKGRQEMFPESTDPSDPWQFVNIRVM